MFLLYINDISAEISLSLRLFADNCVLYRIIKSDQDQLHLQSDLNLISRWSKSWQMRFNINKCVTLKCYRLLHPRTFIYHLDSQPLACVIKHTNLEILLTSKLHCNMSFSSHITNTTSKASRMLNLLRRNLCKCSKEIKTIAHLSLVHPILEYSSIVWDFHSSTDVLYIAKIRRRAA